MSDIQIDDTFNDDTVVQTFGVLENMRKIMCLKCGLDYQLYQNRAPIGGDGMCRRCFDEANAGKMRLIGIAGQARSGKDTAANYLLEKLGDDWSSASFADPMKAMLGVIGVDCSDEAKDLPRNEYGVSTRHMLQTLGTEWGRNGIGSYFWIDVFERYNAGKSVIVPDVRFENEAELIREHGVLICIEGRGGIDGGHISERKLQYDDRDIYIDNQGSLSELYEKLDSIDFDSE